MRVSLLVGLVLVTAVALSAQSAITEAQARAAAKIATAESSGDEDKFLKTYQRELRKVDPQFSASDYVDVLTSDSTRIWAQGPVTAFGSAMGLLVRLMETSRDVSWPKGVTVIVRPLRVDGSDFIKIAVSNDGQQAEPISSDLKPDEFTTGLGAKVSRYSGSVTFPVEAFRIGTVITAIPASGLNFTKKLSEKDLRRLK